MADSSEGAAEVVLSPGEAARRLGVSPSGLRRLAGPYGAVFGELPKDHAGTSRIWPLEAVERLERARALMAAGQARSIADALRAVEGGAVAAAEAALQLGEQGRVAEALGVVAAQLEAVLSSNRRLEAEVEALRSEVGELRQLPPTSAVGRIDQQRPNGAAEVEAPLHFAKVPDEAGEDGPMVRAARWLERRLRARG